MYIDMTGFEDKSSNFIETEGDFLVKCDGIVGKSEDDHKGTPWIDVRFRTKDSHIMKERLYVNDKSLWRLGSLMSSVGISQDDIKNVKNTDEINLLIKDKTLIIRTKFENGVEDPITREVKKYLRVNRFIKNK